MAISAKLDREHPGVAPLRLGILINTIEGTNLNFAGGQVHTFEVMARLRNVQMVVFAPAFAGSIVKKHLPSAEFIATPSLPRETKNVTLLFLHRALSVRPILHELRRCDVVYASSQFLPDMLPAALAAWGRCTVCIFHIMPPPWRRPGSLLRNAVAYLAEACGVWLVALSCKNAIAGTNHTSRILKMRGVRQPIFITTNGVEHGKPPESVARVANRVVFLGRLSPTKGVGDLIEIWPAIQDGCRNAELLIIGEGSVEYRASLERQVSTHGLAGSIRFLGRVLDAERSEHLASASLFAFPSYEEGWGIAIAEAMAAGLPCVTYQLPVYDDVFPSGRLSAPLGDKTAFAACISRLLNDEPLRETLANEARLLAQTFSWQKAADVEETAIRQCYRERLPN